jgi:hypothetical protein
MAALQSVVAPGAHVRLVTTCAGLAPGTEGIVVGRYSHDDSMIVMFIEAGPLRVEADEIEPVTASAA